MKLRAEFLIVSLLLFIICLAAISLLTNVLMVNIVNDKLNPFGKLYQSYLSVVKVYFSKQTDIVASIAENIKDEF
jgi:hypothetical protein